MTYLPPRMQPDCKGGVTRWESGRALVLSHSDSCTGRVNETVRLSTDNGRTFPFAQLIDPASGYSTVQMCAAAATLSALIRCSWTFL